VINHCHDNGIAYAIGGDLDEAVKKGISTIENDEWRPYQNGFIGETVHCMNRTKEASRLVMIRPPFQDSLSGSEESTQRYTVISTNRQKKLQRGTISVGSAAKTGSRS